MENYVARKEIGDYRITIFYDDSPSNPMKDWDLAGCYLFEYDRLHRLSDLCNWEEVWGKHSDCNHSMEETLRAMVKEYCDFDLFVRYIKSKDVEIKVKDAEIEALKAELEAKDNSKEMEAKDAEIARLKAELAEAKKKGAESKDESKDNTEGESKEDAKPAEGTEEKKKGGRPRKEE